MLKQEFEERVGYRVSTAIYERIEKEYMAKPDVNKDAFCMKYKKAAERNKIMSEMAFSLDMEMLESESYSRQANYFKKEIERLKSDISSLNIELTKQVETIKLLMKQKAEIEEKMKDILFKRPTNL